MRACQGYPQFDECSSRSISMPESRRQNDFATWHTNSVSVEENVVNSIHTLPEAAKQEQTITSPKKTVGRQANITKFSGSKFPGWERYNVSGYPCLCSIKGADVQADATA